jgi:hypothetical protein
VYVVDNAGETFCEPEGTATDPMLLSMVAEVALVEVHESEDAVPCVTVVGVSVMVHVGAGKIVTATGPQFVLPPGPVTVMV